MDSLIWLPASLGVGFYFAVEGTKHLYRHLRQRRLDAQNDAFFRDVIKAFETVGSLMASANMTVDTPFGRLSLQNGRIQFTGNNAPEEPHLATVAPTEAPVAESEPVAPTVETEPVEAPVQDNLANLQTAVGELQNMAVSSILGQPVSRENQKLALKKMVGCLATMVDDIPSREPVEASDEDEVVV